MELHMAAVLTGGDITAQLPRLAGHEGGCCFALYRCGLEGSGVLCPGVVKGLLDLKSVRHDTPPILSKGLTAPPVPFPARWK